MLLEYCYRSYILFKEHYHIYHSIIDVGTTNLNIAYPQERWWSVNVQVTQAALPLKSGLP
jgi:hypothetical protein